MLPTFFDEKQNKPKYFHVDPQRHVKMWFSKDGLPEKHKARFIKFRLLNPNAKLTLIYSDKYLSSQAKKEMLVFAKELNIMLIAYEALTPVSLR